MGTRTGNPTWEDSPSTATLITADRLNAIEEALDASGTSSLAIGTTGTDAAPGNHLHDSRYIRTVNGTGPDGAGNVTVAGGGGTAGPPPFPVISGNFLSTAPIAINALSSAANCNAGYVYAALVPVAATIPVNRLSCLVKDTGTGRTVEMGIWQVRPADGLAGTLVATSGPLNADTAVEISATISVTLTPGWYWVGLMALGAQVSIEHIPGQYTINAGDASGAAARGTLQRWGGSPWLSALVSDVFDSGSKDTSSRAPVIRVRIA